MRDVSAPNRHRCLSWTKKFRPAARRCRGDRYEILINRLESTVDHERGPKRNGSWIHDGPKWAGGYVAFAEHSLTFRGRCAYLHSRSTTTLYSKDGRHRFSALSWNSVQFPRAALILKLSRSTPGMPGKGVVKGQSLDRGTKPWTSAPPTWLHLNCKCFSSQQRGRFRE